MSSASGMDFAQIGISLPAMGEADAFAWGVCFFCFWDCWLFWLQEIARMPMNAIRKKCLSGILILDGFMLDVYEANRYHSNLWHKIPPRAIKPVCSDVISLWFAVCHRSIFAINTFWKWQFLRSGLKQITNFPKSTGFCKKRKPLIQGLLRSYTWLRFCAERGLIKHHNTMYDHIS